MRHLPTALIAVIAALAALVGILAVSAAPAGEVGDLEPTAPADDAPQRYADALEQLAHGDGSAWDATATAFVEAIQRRLAVLPATCDGPLATLPGIQRCGRFAAGSAVDAAHAEAMRLAERQVPVLDVQLANGVPPYQLVALPGFEPLPQLAGFSRRTYLIGDRRVVIWFAPADAAGSRRIAFTVERLTGPFPKFFPVER